MNSDQGWSRKWGDWTIAQKVREQNVVIVELGEEALREAAGFGAGIVSHPEDRG